MGEGAFIKRDRDWQPAALTPSYRSTQKRSPNHKPLIFDPTVSEITGPTFGHSIIGELDNDLIRNFSRDGQDPIGERVMVHGRLLDQNARPVPNVLMEFWQANAGGRYRHKNDGYLAPLDPNFGGCGRTMTDGDGYYSFRTIRPGPYPWPNGGNDWRPAHIHFSLFGTGFTQRLISQMYFEGDPLIWLCPIAAAIPTKDGVEQLIARLDMDATIPMDLIAYKFDIILRGRHSTMFENKLEGN